MILHANISGAGEPIVFLHSGGMTGLTEFEEQTEFFKKESYKIIRPDLRGHGKTGGSIKKLLFSMSRRYKRYFRIFTSEPLSYRRSFNWRVSCTFICQKVSGESKIINFFWDFSDENRKLG